MTHAPNDHENAPEPLSTARGRALRLQAYGGPSPFAFDTIEARPPGDGEVLVRVKAAGVNGLDWKVREGFVRGVYPLQLPATLGIEMTGVVLELGAGVAELKVGDRVMGPLGGFGAYADLLTVRAENLARTPDALSDVQAAAIPVAALTASQLLDTAGADLAGKRVLVHGAAGAVGGFVVQLARAAGAQVYATASGSSIGHVTRLGAERVIDRLAVRFEDALSDIDLVIDLVGGDALDRSWSVLAADGEIISTAAPDILGRAPEGRRGVWFTMRPDGARLARLAGQVAAGELSSTLAEVVPFADLPAAIERNRTGHAPGKMVVDLTC